MRRLHSKAINRCCCAIRLLRCRRLRGLCSLAFRSFGIGTWKGSLILALDTVVGKPWSKVNGFEMRIGELAKQTGFSRDAIRFYEREGLIRAESAREAGNNYKSYGPDAAMTLEVVKDAQAAGMSVADLSILLTQLAAEDAEDFDGDAFLAAKITEVEARIAASQRFLEVLNETRKSLKVAHLG